MESIETLPNPKNRKKKEKNLSFILASINKANNLIYPIWGTKINKQLHPKKTQNKVLDRYLRRNLNIYIYALQEEEDREGRVYQRVPQKDQALPFDRLKSWLRVDAPFSFPWNQIKGN